MSNLLASSGMHVGRRFELREHTSVGRAADNDILLPDHLVSRYHAIIERQGTEYVLRDLGSKNGLRVNGEAALEHRLAPGDRVQIGKTGFVFDAPEDVRTARFSDRMVRLERAPDLPIEIHRPESLPPPPGTMESAILDRLGNLFDSDNEQIHDQLQRTLEELLGCFGAVAGVILLRDARGEAMPLVAISPGDELRVRREAVDLVLAEGKTILAAPPGEGRELRFMIAPLLRRTTVFGAIGVERPPGTAFTTETLAWLVRFARVVAGAVRYAIQTEQLILSAEGQRSTEPIVGVSPSAQGVREHVRKLGPGHSTVLLTGETGTGKELVARALHEASERVIGRFVAIDCSSISPNLLESELFGHEAGAFTGADRLKRGKVEMADGGTLFLDEIGELAIDLQPKLLRFMEERLFYRVGGIRPIPCDVRIIAATNRNLERAVEEGRFRRDLFYRLKVVPLHLPPLRERLEDVRPLIEYFAPRLAAKVGKPFLGLVDEAWMILERNTWPGNVRELRHSLERALILSDDGILRPEHFQLAPAEEVEGDHVTTDARTGTIDQTYNATRTGGVNLTPPSLDKVEAEAIRRALRYAGGNRVKAAEILNIHRNTLARKIAEYEIDM